MTKKEIALLLSVALVLTLGLVFSLNTGQLEIYPYKENSGTAYYVAHEGVEKNWSEISSNVGQDGAINFKYTLSKALSEPFVALYLHKVTGPNLYYDFSDFNEMRIHLSSLKGKRIPIYLTLDNKHYQPKSDVLLAMPLMQVIDYAGEQEYRLRKKDFEIPSWWLRYHGLKKEDIGDIDFATVNYIMVNSCQTLEPGDSDEISIKSIVFAHDNRMHYWIYAGLMLLLAGFTLLRIFLLKRRAPIPAREISEIKILVPYQANAIDESRSSSKIQRIVNYIATNYAEPELGINDLEKALGITAREIGSSIKEEFGVSFKSYLNRIRLSEIKRLLIESDLPVSDIAYRTGYNNIPHFNRVFKAECDMSPKEFRANNQAVVPK